MERHCYHSVTHTKLKIYIHRPIGHSPMCWWIGYTESCAQKYCEGKKNWGEQLQLALYFIRMTPSATTGFSPYMIVQGWELTRFYMKLLDEELKDMDISRWVGKKMEDIRDRVIIWCYGALKKHHQSFCTAKI